MTFVVTLAGGQIVEIEAETINFFHGGLIFHDCTGRFVRAFAAGRWDDVVGVARTA